MTTPETPGPDATRRNLERMLRVDHAGECGAIRIYQGQLAVLGRTASAETIRHMEVQEQAHKDTFDKMMAERRVRPTALMPLWDAAGYALGAATALMGEKAAMACTAAVEEVIDDHYRQQSDILGRMDPALKDTVDRFRADEVAHRDTALAHGAEQTPGYETLTRFIKAGCRLAIKLSERV